MSTPAVSVIVPVYNVENFIERCVASIAAQTFRDFEAIFVDDCSPDNSMDALHRALELTPITNVKIVRHEANQGLAQTRVDGINAAQGSYIIHVDSDDYVHPDYLELLYKAAIQHDADLVICDFAECHQHEIIDRSQVIPEKSNELVRSLLTGEVFNSVCTKLVKKNLLVKHDIFQIQGLNYLEDKSVSFRVAYFAKKVVHVAQPLYFYDVSNPTALTRLAKQEMIPQAMKLLKLIDSFFAVHPADDTITSGIHVCRALIEGMIVMHGNKSQRHEYLPEIGPFKLCEALKATTLPWHYKVFVFCNKSHLHFLSAFLRLCYKLRAFFKKF